MTARNSHQPPGGYRFRHLARMEWIKLRSLRSTWIALALTVIAPAGIALATGGSNTTSGGTFVSYTLTFMLIGVLIADEAAAFLSFFAGGMTLRHGITAPALSQPGVLRAIVLTGASLSLIAVFGLGLGAIIRHTAAAITVVVGIVFVGGTFIGQSDFAIRPYLPLYIVSHSLGATGPACLPGMASCWLSPWSGLGVLAGYAAIAMLLGGLMLARRDV
jgi:ABC-2 type transport system permease protein